MGFLDWLRAKRGVIYPGQEYWVSIKDITIDREAQDYGITERRIRREDNYWHTMGLYETRVLLDANFKLIDGYSTILVAERNGETKVPANFVYPYGRENKDENN